MLKEDVTAQFNIVRYQCEIMACALETMLQDYANVESRQVISSMFTSDIWFVDKIFRTSHAIPLLRSIGAVEQVWSDIDRHNYRDDMLGIIKYALDILVGERVLVADDCIPAVNRKNRHHHTKPVPAWYEPYLELISELQSSRLKDAEKLSMLVKTAAMSDPTTIAGHLAGCLVDTMLTGYPINVWESVRGKNNTNTKDRTIIEKWKPAEVDWDEVQRLASMMKGDSTFGVRYVCRGWHYVSFALR